MSRPPAISDEEILKVAREVFLAKGLGASTVEIARRTNISEGTLFKRFSTKRKLFIAAVGIGDEDWSYDLMQWAGAGDPREGLVSTVVQLVYFFRGLLPRIMLMWSCREGFEGHLARLRGPEAPPRKGLQALSAFLAKEMELGRIRRMDPQMSARILIGATWNLVFLENLGINPGTATDPEDFARTLINTLWRGWAPPRNL